MANASGSVRLGLLGAGRIGQVHGAAIDRVPGARLVAVSDAVPQAAESVARTYGAEVRDTDAIVGASDIDAVLVCTPTDTHADLIEALSRAGQAIFCEKPIALDLPRTRACLAVVSETKGRLMLGFNRRFDTHFRALKDAVSEGQVGTPELVQITSRDPGPPPVDYIKRSGGLFKDMTIHDFDIARWLLGEEPETVSAHGSVMVDPAIGEAGDIDTASVVLETKSGRQAVITNSRRAAYGYDQRVEVHGAKGCVSLANQRPTDIQFAGAAGYVQPPLHDFFMTRYAGAYAAEIAAFVEVVRSGAAPDPNGQDGLAALTLAEAALLSLREGRRVSVSEIEAGA
ncbi:MAG: inositol 2-dehydrogenase [Pseudomonadota bacterium]